jgi:GMP synthase-like glutamine amidotransferase
MTPDRILKIGLLLCDDVPEDGQKQFGDYASMFRRAINAADNRIELTPYAANQGVLPENPSMHDGYLISGSGASVFEDKQWIKDLMDFVRWCYKTNTKTVGICFGHQLIAHALGGETVRSDNGWGFGIHSTRLTTRPQFIKAGNEHYNLVVIHQDQVMSLPSGFDTIASSEFCPNSMITDGKVMLGIQGHPEFGKDYCAYRAEFRRDTIGEDKYQETIDLLANNEPDSTEVFAWVSRFFRQAG